MSVNVKNQGRVLGKQFFSSGRDERMVDTLVVGCHKNRLVERDKLCM